MPRLTLPDCSLSHRTDTSNRLAPQRGPTAPVAVLWPWPCMRPDAHRPRWMHARPWPAPRLVSPQTLHAQAARRLAATPCHARRWPSSVVCSVAAHHLGRGRPMIWRAPCHHQRSPRHRLQQGEGRPHLRVAQPSSNSLRSLHLASKQLRAAQACCSRSSSQPSRGCRGRRSCSVLRPTPTTVAGVVQAAGPHHSHRTHASVAAHRQRHHRGWCRRGTV